MRQGPGGNGTPERGRRELGRLSRPRMFTARRAGARNSNQAAVPTRLHAAILLERSKLLPLFLPLAEATAPSLRCKYREGRASTQAARRRRFRYVAQFVSDRPSLSHYRLRASKYCFRPAVGRLEIVLLVYR